MNASHRWTHVAIAALLAASASASSHREAPGTTEIPKADGTDFYMFRSYEPGQSDKLILIANYQPVQAAYGGPNYFFMDEDVQYEIHLDTDGDAAEDLIFRFQFDNEFRNIEVPTPGGSMVTIPLLFAGQVTDREGGALNLVERYGITLVTGDRETGTAQALTHDGGNTVFVKPFDNAGTKTFPDYAEYAAEHVYTVNYPGGGTGRVFVGQRQDPFRVNLGEIFDLVNIPNLTSPDAQNSRENALEYSNVTSFIIEVPISEVVGADPVIGAWTTSHIGGEQVSRLGMGLVNEVVIGIDKKDTFNASEPSGDGQFLGFVADPSFPVLLEVLYGSAGYVAPTLSPRQDLIDVFLLGVAGLNRPATVTPSEMLRINTSTAPVPRATQNRLGVIGGDAAGYPNGRRPGDDLVDITLRVASGVLLTPEQAPAGQIPLTDGTIVNAQIFQETFPFLNTPVPGSPGRENRTTGFVSR